MPAIGPDLVGHVLDPVAWTWDDRNVMLYALGIGARLPEDLPFLYEAHGPRVAAPFPLAATTLALPPLVAALGLDLRALLHAAQAIELHRAPAAEGRATVTRRVTGAWDKGRAAIVDCEDAIEDADGPLATARSAWWVQGAGGFGGARSAATATRCTSTPTWRARRANRGRSSTASARSGCWDTRWTARVRAGDDVVVGPAHATFA